MSGAGTLLEVHDPTALVDVQRGGDVARVTVAIDERLAVAEAVVARYLPGVPRDAVLHEAAAREPDGFRWEAWGGPR